MHFAVRKFISLNILSIFLYKHVREKLRDYKSSLTFHKRTQFPGKDVIADCIIQHHNNPMFSENSKTNLVLNMNLYALCHCVLGLVVLINMFVFPQKEIALLTLMRHETLKQFATLGLFNPTGGL